MAQSGKNKSEWTVEEYEAYMAQTGGKGKRVARLSKHKSCRIGGIWFASKKEADRWQKLICMQQTGYIKDLQRQQTLKIIINGHKVCGYRYDHRYTVVETGEDVVEDVKGYRTEMYNLKKKLVRAVLGIDIKEV